MQPSQMEVKSRRKFANLSLLKDHFKSKRRIQSQLRNKFLWSHNESEIQKSLNESREEYDKLATQEAKNKYITNILRTPDVNEHDLKFVMSFLDYNNEHEKRQMLSTSNSNSSVRLKNKRVSLAVGKRTYLISP